ncbi:hypothetical protein [Succinimonas amylolytica]|uniref:hypothetical protein n=1 Tax=Succinimonas amylolytica TaxID=83769 RepID=UPI00036A17FA|nr:hypothetical protein [Succinimonas amylolytica]
MDREKAKEYLKSMLPQYLKKRGILPSGYFNCLNPAHRDSRPMMSFNPKDNTVHCFGCGATYDIFGVLGIDCGLNTYAEQFNRACELFLPEEAIQPPRIRSSGIRQVGSRAQPEKAVDYSAYLRECASRVRDTEYFRDIGLSQDIIQKYNLGMDPEFKGANGDTFPAVIIPHGIYGFLAINLEEPEDSAFRLYYGRDSLFNPLIPPNADRLFITFTELEALALLEVGAPVIALGNSANIGELITVMSQLPLNRICYLVDSGDPDWRGLTEIIKGELASLGIRCETLSLSYPWQNVVEYLTRDREDFKQRLLSLDRIIHASGKRLPEILRFSPVTDEDSFMEPSFLPGIYAVCSSPEIRRRLVASWVLHADPESMHYIYVSGERDWMLLGQNIYESSQIINEKYSLQFPKIELALPGNGTDPAEAALEITNLLLAHRIKNETENTILINADRHGNTDDRRNWYLSLLDELSQRLAALRAVVVVFFRKSEYELASEVGDQVFRISSALDCDAVSGCDEEPDTTTATVLTRENSGEPVSFEIRLE